MAVDFEFKFQIDIHPERLQQVVDAPNGKVSQAIRQTSERLMTTAASRIGKKYSGTNNNHDGRNGRIAQSGKLVQGSGSDWRVIFDHPAAAAHHNGASDHEYGPGFHINKHPNTWTNSPYRDNHFALKGPFSHPGNAANPFLLDAARQLGLRSSGALKRGTAGPFPLVRARPGFF